MYVTFPFPSLSKLAVIKPSLCFWAAASPLQMLVISFASLALSIISVPQHNLACFWRLPVDFALWVSRNRQTFRGLVPFPLQCGAAHTNSWQCQPCTTSRAWLEEGIDWWGPVLCQPFVTILPPFFHFFSLTRLHMPLVPTPLIHVLLSCASKSRDLSSLTLHSHALSSLPMPLFGSLRLCHGFLLHSSDSFVYDSLVPFSTIHLPHLVCFLIPIYITGTSRFTPIRSLMLPSLIPYYT